MDKIIYLHRVLEQVPRLLTQMDRNPESPTYGCADRSYWHYKTVCFPCARHQEAAYTLALLYTTKDDANVYYHNPKIREWALAAINYWAKIQAPDGSFSEWFWGEKSFVATSFSTLAMLETSRELCISPPDAVNKACEWIDGHDEPLVSNQAAGALLALWHWHPDKYAERVQRFLDRQNQEGWFTEYGGFDVGYSYVLLDYLARIYLRYHDERLKASCDKLIDFLSYFMHPDGSVGRYYTSRSTSYLIPSGLEIISTPLARAIADVEIRRLEKEPIHWDDRYLCYELYYHLLAFRHYKEAERFPLLPYQKSVDIDFPIAGLKVTSNPVGRTNYYRVESKDGRYFEYDGGRVRHNPEPYSPTPLMTPAKSVLLNLFQMTLGRNDVMAKWLKKLLRDNLIMKKRSTGSIYVPSARYYHKNDLED